MYERINNTIITIIEIGNEVYDKVDNLGVEDRLTRLIKELVKSIKQKLSHSDDMFFKYAYENADVLHEIVQYHPVNEGGSHRNGKIYIGKKGFASSDMGSDGDIKATIFHEYMHYINFKFNIYPKRYINIELGEIFSEWIDIEDDENSQKVFVEDTYTIFLSSKMATGNKEEFNKYLNYPDLYTELDNLQKQEVDSYMKEKDLKQEGNIARYRYVPSNHYEDEVNAHKKTLDGHQLGVFIMSDVKLSFYDREIENYRRLYTKSIQIESKYGYSNEGYKNK